MDKGKLWILIIISILILAAIEKLDSDEPLTNEVIIEQDNNEITDEELLLILTD